ncbi:MAG: hypothetical protein ACKVP4_13025 [Hyphomicrobium sp.]
MGADYAEMEREFVGALGEDTGKSLDDWMAAIAATRLRDRNEIIDWLRHQGFIFSRASWLERIHHNGGRLIYGGVESLGGAAPAIEPLPRSASEGPKAASPPSSTLALVPSADIVALLTAAKGLRPLADVVMREIRAAVPAVRFDAESPLIVASAPTPFLALWPQPRQIRLYGDFSGVIGPDVRSAEAVLKSPPPFPQMLALDDARRITPAFRELLIAAAARAKA